jgi:hypothetical protein
MHWASLGFAALAVQHPGSDDTILHNNSPLRPARAFKVAMNPEELTRRADDLRFVLGAYRPRRMPAGRYQRGAESRSVPGIPSVPSPCSSWPANAAPARNPGPTRACAPAGPQPLGPPCRQGPRADQRFGHIRLPFLASPAAATTAWASPTSAQPTASCPTATCGRGRQIPARLCRRQPPGFCRTGQPGRSASVFNIRREPAPFRDICLLPAPPSGRPTWADAAACAPLAEHRPCPAACGRTTASRHK